ncbi:hypothetical protein ACJX0J_037768, partial [Zea mays]
MMMMMMMMMMMRDIKEVGSKPITQDPLQHKHNTLTLSTNLDCGESILIAMKNYQYPYIIKKHIIAEGNNANGWKCFHDQGHSAISSICDFAHSFGISYFHILHEFIIPCCICYMRSVCHLPILLNLGPWREIIIQTSINRKNIYMNSYDTSRRYKALSKRVFFLKTNEGIIFREVVITNHFPSPDEMTKVLCQRTILVLSIVVLHREHQDEFVHKRTKGFWMKLAVASWITAFLKQFQDSVSKSDYEALRSAFVVEHYPEKPDIDFHKYMTRAVEYEFKRVVGISWYLWLFVILFLLLNINGWHTYFWLAFLPLFLLLIVGAKLEHIITRLAQEAAISLSNNTEEVPKIKPCKDHFWFHKPELVLHLIHFILFQNSFEISFFFWILVSEGFGSCMMERKPYVISRLVIGVIIEVICSYITLPLYAIVTH